MIKIKQRAGESSRGTNDKRISKNFFLSFFLKYLNSERKVLSSVTIPLPRFQEPLGPEKIRKTLENHQQYLPWRRPTRFLRFLPSSSFSFYPPSHRFRNTFYPFHDTQSTREIRKCARSFTSLFRCSPLSSPPCSLFHFLVFASLALIN